MAKKIVASDSQDDAGRKDEVVSKSKVAQFQARCHAVNNSLGMVGRANRDAIGKHYELGLWLAKDKGYQEALKRGRSATTAYRKLLNGGKDLEESQKIAIRRATRIHALYATKELACEQPSVLVACQFESKPERIPTDEKRVWYTPEGDQKLISDEMGLADARIKAAKDKRATTLREATPLTAKERLENALMEAVSAATEMKGAGKVSGDVSKIIATIEKIMKNKNRDYSLDAFLKVIASVVKNITVKHPEIKEEVKELEAA